MKDSKNRDHIVLLSASAFELLEKVKTQPFTKIVISLLVAQTLVISQMGLFALISQKSIKNIACGESFVDEKELDSQGSPSLTTPHGLVRATFRTWHKMTG